MCMFCVVHSGDFCVLCGFVVVCAWAHLPFVDLFKQFCLFVDLFVRLAD